MKPSLIAVALLLSLSSVCWAQSPVSQSGGVIKNHAAKWQTKGVVSDAGPASGGNANVGISELPIVGLGKTLCLYDAPTTNALGYHQLCLAANDGGNATISLTSGGSAIPNSLDININGTAYPFPGSGNGDVVGPSLSVANEFALFNGTSGKLLQTSLDKLIVHSYAFPSGFTSTPTNAVTFQFGTAFPIAGQMPAGTLQGIVSTMTVPNSYTQAPWPPATFAAYVDNQNSANTNSTVGYFHTGYANAPGSGTLGNNVTGYNTVVQNTDPVNGYAAPNLGKDFGQMVGFEADNNIWKKAAGITPAGKVDGFVAIAGGEVVPTGGSTAFRVGYVGGGVPWTTAFITDNGAASAGLVLGSVLNAVSQASQGIQLNALNDVGTAVPAVLQVVPDGAVGHFDLRVPTGSSFRVQVNNTEQQTLGATSFNSLPPIKVGSLTQVLSANGIAIFHAATDENFQIRGHTDLADGITLQSINDALGASESFQITATALRLQTTSINVAGSPGVTCAPGAPTGSFQTLQGIVIHC